MFNGDQSVDTAAELLREALQVQQRALPECRHVWRCLCLEGVPQQNSGSFHDASFQREPRPYVTAACLRHNCAASVQLKAMVRDSRLSSALRDASRGLLEWFIGCFNSENSPQGSPVGLPYEYEALNTAGTDPVLVSQRR